MERKEIKEKLKNLLRLYTNSIKDYELESGHSIGQDERESIEFVDIFIDSEDAFDYTELIESLSCNSDIIKTLEKYQTHDLKKGGFSISPDNYAAIANELNSVGNSDKETEEIPKPIGDYIMSNSKHIQREDGAYYHYADVCRLIRNYSKSEVKKELPKDLDQRLRDTLSCFERKSSTTNEAVSELKILFSAQIKEKLRTDKEGYDFSVFKNSPFNPDKHLPTDEWIRETFPLRVTDGTDSTVNYNCSILQARLGAKAAIEYMQPETVEPKEDLWNGQLGEKAQGIPDKFLEQEKGFYCAEKNHEDPRVKMGCGCMTQCDMCKSKN